MFVYVTKREIRDIVQARRLPVLGAECGAELRLVARAPQEEGHSLGSLISRWLPGLRRPFPMGNSNIPNDQSTHSRIGQDEG